MESLNIVFTGQNKVETRHKPVPTLQAGQILVEGSKSLISTGTECICLARHFAPETHWDDWVKYPFYPGYSHTGRVLQIAPDVSHLKIGDRIAARVGHRQRFVVQADQVLPLRDEVSDEAGAWFALAAIVQNGIRKAQLELGDTVVVMAWDCSASWRCNTRD